jgi:hypothetical protein
MQNVKREAAVYGLRNVSKKLDWHEGRRLELPAV